MLIKEIELNNFRIYKGENRINLLPKDDKNIIIVSGKNGFGKTTFLMALVWCLYGKQMSKVDAIYKKEISDNGGIWKYIGNSLNRLAATEGKTRFSVSVTFIGVKIPDITCNEVKITRSFDVKTGTEDKVEILIDGYANELIQDLSRDNQSGEEIFIRDFILPLEIAKFFFFDAEKIVSLAEVNSSEQRRALSMAYSEVLGIHKYEELKSQLESIQDDYRKKSASPKDRKELIDTEAKIKSMLIDITDIEKQRDELNRQKDEKKYESDKLQKKLIREGNHMTIEEVNDLKNKEVILEKTVNELFNDLRELFDLIPFGLAGETLLDISVQLDNERKLRETKFMHEDIDNKTNEFLNDLEKAKNSTDIVTDFKTRRFYEDQIRILIKKHFFGNLIDLPESFDILHDFSDSQTNQLNELINNLKLSFKEKFARINGEYSQAKNQIDTIRRRLRDAEKNAEDAYISDLRIKKETLDKRIVEIEGEMETLTQHLGEQKNELKTLRQKQEELRKRIDVSQENKAKDEKIEQIINELKEFIIQFKEEKKKSLETSIKKGLTTLMHKKDFISRVEVDISHSGEDVEISLFTMINGKERKIDKGSLSMGERQMYASALLNALVDESDIEFPVFIDSPMQKFDKEHAENIIKHFYPNVSEQVVLFPLIHKELTKEEYQLLQSKISKTYLINNLNNDSSTFFDVQPNKLIEQYDQIYVASN